MAGQRYEVRVNGLVPTQDLLDALGGVEVAQHELRTVVTGSFPDQAALYGFLHRLRAFGLEVIEVHRVPTGSPEPEPDATEPGTTEPGTTAPGTTAPGATAPVSEEDAPR